MPKGGGAPLTIKRLREEYGMMPSDYAITAHDTALRLQRR
jgi:hypothetical protein